MSKQRPQLSPIRDLSSAEAMNRFVVELNSIVEWISQRLPSLDQDTIVDMRQKRGSVASIVNTEAVSIPDVIDNPVDLNALKVDLTTRVMPVVNSELASLRADIREIATIAAKIADTMTD